MLKLLLLTAVLLIQSGEGLKCWECDVNPNAPTPNECYSDHRGKSVDCNGTDTVCAIHINHLVNEPQVVWKFCETRPGRPAGKCEDILNTKYTFMENCYCNDKDDCNKDMIDDKGGKEEF
ncbi:unnamed protein product [Orchesella dallaii]|uniref:Protein quiver n=1 Tax=Orchesella dallaii TaxID=48710 RepID=A0ABP1SAX4_9HEXA